jgi:hypothetical protein
MLGWTALLQKKIKMEQKVNDAVQLVEKNDAQLLSSLGYNKETESGVFCRSYLWKKTLQNCSQVYVFRE